MTRRKDPLERLAELPRRCTRKRRFATRATAMQAIALSTAVVPLYAYRCRDCHGWHLSKQAPAPTNAEPADLTRGPGSAAQAH